MGQNKTPLGIFGVLSLCGALSVALSVTLSGCGSNRVEALRMEPANPFTGTVKPMEGGVTQVKLGSEDTEGAYGIRLTTDAAPKVGANRFVAHITQKGQPAKNLLVTVALTRASLDQPGPAAAMDPTGPGAYAASLNIPQDGGWLAKVTVVGVKETDDGFFALSTNGQAAGLQPQEDATSVQRGAGKVMPLPNAPGTYGNGQFGRD